MRAGNNGITADTVKNIQFGAGTIHKGLKYTEGSGWNFAESCVGATKGGSSVKIEPEFYTVEPDGSSVAVKNFKRKIGEKAEMEVNLLELNADMLKASVIGADGVSEVEGMNLIVSKDAIAEGDYWENIAFVGETLDGKEYWSYSETEDKSAAFYQLFDGRGHQDHTTKDHEYTVCVIRDWGKF